MVDSLVGGDVEPEEGARQGSASHDAHAPTPSCVGERERRVPRNTNGSMAQGAAVIELTGVLVGLDLGPQRGQFVVLVGHRRLPAARRSARRFARGPWVSTGTRAHPLHRGCASASRAAHHVHVVSLAKILHRSDQSSGAAIDELGPSPRAVRATHVALWLLVAVGALGGVVGALRSTPDPGGAPPVPQSEAVPPEVMGRAEVAVREWLTTGEFGSAHEEAAADFDQTAAHMSVLWASAVGGRLVEPDYWAVTVAADVRVTEDQGPAEDDEAPTSASNAARWLLEVGVLRSGGAVTVVGPPAVVPSPPAPEVELRPLEATPERDDPMTMSAEAFLRSLLTGDGDVGRYTAPGSSVPPLTPAPFETVTVEGVGIVRADPATSTIRVDASAVTAAEVEVSLSYELVMAERDGRWEVKALSGAPSVHRDPRPGPGGTGSDTDGRDTEDGPRPTAVATTTKPPVPGA